MEGDARSESREPLSTFQRLCQSILGYPCLFTRPEVGSPPCAVIFLQAFTSLSQIQRPWWKMCGDAGIFFFRRHVLLNFGRTARSLEYQQDELREMLARDGYTECEMPDCLEHTIEHVTTGDIDEWIIWQFPTESDGQAYIALLQFMRTLQMMNINDIDDFEEWKGAPSVLRQSRMQNFVMEAIENAHVAATDELEDRKRMQASPGEYYASLVPPERVRPDECWLFRPMPDSP